MAVLINSSTGLAENLDPQATQQALAKGTHNVPLNDPQGNPVAAPHGEAQDLLGQGFQQPSPEQLKQLVDHAKNQGLGEQLKGAAEGAAEMIVPIIGTTVEKSLGAKESDIARRRETTGHLIGQLGGAIAPEALLGKLGGVAEKKLATEAVERSIPNKIGSAAAKMAVENAVFQGKDEVAKLMVHDPEQSTDTALANIGMAGLFGGALGGASQGAAELWKMGPGAKLGQLLSGLQNKSAGLPSGLKSTAGLDLAPELISALGDSPKAREAAQILMESNSKAGAELQASLADFKQKASEAFGEALGHSPESIDSLASLSKAETGHKFQESLARSVEEKVQPIADKYNKITEQFLSAPVLELERANIADRIAQHIQESGLAKGPNDKALNLAQKALEQLPKQETVQDLRMYAKGLYEAAPFGSEQYATGKALRTIFSDAQDFLIGNAAGAEFHATQAEYGKFKGLLQDLNDRLHLGREGKGGATTFAKAVQQMSPEDVVRRLSLKSDSQLQGLLAEHFPDVSQAARAYELDNLVKQSLNKDGTGIDIAKFTKKLNALEPEHRGHLLDAEMQKKVEALSELVGRVPGKMNTSGTAKTLDKLWEKMPAGIGGLLSMMTGHNPVLGYLFGEMAHYVGRELPDSIRLAMLKFMGSDAPLSASGFAAAAKLATQISKGENAITKAAETIFQGGSFAATAGLAKERDKLKEQLDKASNDPEKLMNIAGEVGHYMPDHGAMLASSAARALQYLNSLRPNTAPQSPLDGKEKANSVAEARYNRAIDIANKPLIVAEAIKDGTLTQTDVQHLRALYPALAVRLQSKLGQEMVDAQAAHKTVPYKTQIALSLFMGQPLISSLKQPNIAASQPPINQMMSQQRIPKATPSRADKLGKLPNIYETPQQSRSMYRTSKH